MVAPKLIALFCFLACWLPRLVLQEFYPSQSLEGFSGVSVGRQVLPNYLVQLGFHYESYNKIRVAKFK